MKTWIAAAFTAAAVTAFALPALAQGSGSGASDTCKDGFVYDASQGKCVKTRSR